MLLFILHGTQPKGLIGFARLCPGDQYEVRNIFLIILITEKSQRWGAADWLVMVSHD